MHIGIINCVANIRKQDRNRNFFDDVDADDDDAILFVLQSHRILCISFWKYSESQIDMQT